MRHEARWAPSKYAMDHGVLRPSSDRRELAPSSRLFAALIADFYNAVIPRYATGDLLDLGCGKQPLYGSYAGSAAWIVGVDWPSSLHASHHIDVYCDINVTLPFRSDSFDTVLSSDVLEHVPDPQLMFREVARVLRPGGVLLLNTPFLYPVHEAPHDYLRHTRFSLMRLATDVGMEVLLLEELGGVLDVLADTIGKLAGQIPIVGPHIAGAIQGIAVRLRHSLLFRHGRTLTSAHYPLGHGMVALKPAISSASDLQRTSQQTGDEPSVG